MHKDVKHKGKTYRIIWEEMNVAHPDRAIVNVYERPNTTPIFSKDGTNADITEMIRTAELYIQGL